MIVRVLAVSGSFANCLVLVCWTCLWALLSLWSTTCPCSNLEGLRSSAVQAGSQRHDPNLPASSCRGRYSLYLAFWQRCELPSQHQLHLFHGKRTAFSFRRGCRHQSWRWYRNQDGGRPCDPRSIASSSFLSFHSKLELSHLRRTEGTSWAKTYG